MANQLQPKERQVKTEIFIIAILITISLLIASCGGGGDGNNDNPKPTTNTPPTISGINESYIVPALGKLEIKAIISDADNDPLSIEWDQLTGSPLWQEQPAGVELTLKMPPDNGVDQKFKIKVIVSDGKEDISYTTTITVPTSTAKIVEDVSEYDGSYTGEAPDSDLRLIIDAINSQGVLEASADKFEIKFSSSTGAVLEFNEELEITLYSAEAVKITEMFRFDEQNNLLYIKDESLSSFINFLQQSNELIQLDISGYDSHGNDISKEINFYYGYGKIKGTLIDESGNPYDGIEGEIIEIVGGFKSKTYSVTVKSDSTFEFIDLPPDTYNINLLTSDFKIAVSSVLINSSSQIANISPIVIDLKNPDSNPKTKVKKDSTSLKASPQRLQYHYVTERAFRLDKPVYKSENEELIGSIITTSASEGIPIIKKEIFEIPKEIKK